MAITLSLDNKTKKLYILFFGLIISYIPIIIFENLDIFEEICGFEKLTRALSKMIVFIPFFIYNIFCNKKEGMNNNIILENKAKDYIILILFPIIYFLSKLIVTIFMDTYEFIKQSLTLIFLSFFVKSYTEFKFYNFNILSVTIFAILSIIIEVFIYEQNFTFKLIILYILSSVLYSADLNYRKYLMDYKYISFYKVLSFCGLIDFIVIIFLQVLITQRENPITFNGKEVKMPIQYKDLDSSYLMIICGSVPIFVCYLIHIIIFYLLILNFTALHAVAIDTIILSIQSIYKFEYKNNVEKYIILIILLILSILCLFIYLEIIELKFCGFDENIRKNILKRMDDETYKESKLESEKGIDMGNGYILEYEKNNSTSLNKSKGEEDEDTENKLF